jgi:prepilin-type processing-associated H-X9-DG protein
MAERGRHSGALYRAERVLAGVGTRDYYARLRQSLNDAEAVLALNPVIAAMFEPYSSRMRIVPWDMDAARLPWPAAQRPEAGETGRAAPGANGASAEWRPAVGVEGGAERPTAGGWNDAVTAGSNHPGGVNIGFCDGSVRFVKNTVSLQTWWAIGTRAIGEVVSSDSY